MKETLRKQTRHCNNSQSGFTLLELLVSIVLIVMIVAIVGAAMRLGYKSMDKGEKKAELQERFKVSLDLMDSQIQSGIPLKTTDEITGGINQYVFEGKKDTLRFASNYSLLAGQKGYVVVAYRIETGPDSKQTLFAQENTVGIENQREVKLLEGLDDIHFEYFYKGATDEEGQWIEEWVDTVTIPGKIRIHLALNNWKLSLIVPVRTKPISAQRAPIFASLLHPGGVFS